MKRLVCGLSRVLLLFSGAVFAEEHTAPFVSPLEPPFIVGWGQGDLSKGRLVCERVAELAARADLAKQIRVQVKERMYDRVRERTGHEVEQDIEILREEQVSELLQHVRIIDRHIDPDAGICTSKAVMQKQEKD